MRRLLPLALGLAALALVASGCAGETTKSANADLGNGKTLFTQKCGVCHTMADAGTQGTIGPSLDNAFGYARGDDFKSSTFFEVTLHQMEIPIPPMPEFDNPDTQDFLPEEDRIAIAAYVAACAGDKNAGGGAPTSPACTGQGGGADSTDGKTLFSASCASCHTLKTANATGTIGPNLDDAKPTREKVITQVTNGGGGMPAFRDQLSKQQIEALADFVSKAVGG